MDEKAASFRNFMEEVEGSETSETMSVSELNMLDSVADQLFKYRPPSKHKTKIIRSKVNEKFKCSYCELTFKYATSLYRHVYKHHQTNKYSCPSCGKVNSRVAYLKMHFKSHPQCLLQVAQAKKALINPFKLNETI